MKRRAEISDGTVRVTIEIITKPSDLMAREEVQTALEDIADGCMKAVSNARYLGRPLSRLKVKGV